MNLSTLLNDENEGVNKPPRRPSGAYSRQTPLPALRTESHGSPGGPTSRQSSFEGQNSALLQSPAIQRLTRPEHAYQNPYSPGGSAQYPQNNAPVSPYTTSSISPGNPHPYGHRPSSHASIPSTPSSSHAQTPHTYHESPVSNYPYPTGTSAYHHHPISQPSTPLGPPNGAFRLPSHGNRDSPSILHTLQSPPVGIQGNPEGHYRPSPQSSINHIVNAPTNYRHSPIRVLSPPQSKINAVEDRERSVSVSPKTVLAALPPRLHSAPPRTYNLENTSSLIRDDRDKRSFPISVAIQQTRDRDNYQTTMLDAHSATTSHQSAFLVDPLQQRSTTPETPEVPKKQAVPELETSVLQKRGITTTSIVAPSTRDAVARTNESSLSAQLNFQSIKTQEHRVQMNPILIDSPKVKNQIISSPQSTSLKRAHEGESMNEDHEFRPPSSKRRRYANIPIWAQRCKHTTPLPKHRQADTLNGARHAKPHKRSNAPIQVPSGADDPLGTWDPTFTNIIPHDEITKTLCDFLFAYVVTDQSLKTNPADDRLGSDGILEIEAKLGTIVDKESKNRINLPIQTEAILNQGIDVAFESMMTVDQHKKFNDKLNHELKQSRVPSAPKPRTAMSYSHTNEKDSFFELPPSEIASLPAPLRDRIGVRKPKLRVTRNLITGDITAQIIKIRIADIHIFSPGTLFDWRVSVSAEVNWNGDVQRLAAASLQGTQRSGIPDRNKDRVSYKHQFCQIDLTQVKPSASVGASGATHELEIELDATMVRQQGLAASNSEPNRYEELVRCFVNNVRTLARALG